MRKGLGTVVLLWLASTLPVAAQEDDRDALIALDQAYAQAWIAGDAQAVLSLFTSDATLVPHHGDAPILGRDAMRAFWFDPAWPPTVIREWVREPREVVVAGGVGIVRGRARLVWEYEGTRTTIPESNYVLVALRRPEGWRIRMLTWNDDPRSWTEEPVATVR